MRTDCKTIYRYSELPATAAEKAREETRDRLAEWIESDDLDEVMVESLGYTLGQHEGGFEHPLRGVTIAEWSIDRNGRDYLRLDGTLYPETAPKLPWPDDVGYIRLGRTNVVWTGNDRDAWLIDPETGDATCPEWMADSDREDVTTLFDALDAAIAGALESGCQQYDYLTSEEYAAEWLEANDPETFDEAGGWI